MPNSWVTSVKASDFMSLITATQSQRICKNWKRKEKQDYIKRYNAKGLAWVKYEDGEFSGPIARFLTDENKEALKKEFDLEGGELIVIVADKWCLCCVICVCERRK